MTIARYQICRVSDYDFDFILNEMEPRQVDILVAYPTMVTPTGRLWPNPPEGFELKEDENGPYFEIEHIT